MKIKVSVPATSANIGSGFDALGLAVTLYNTVTFEESEVLDISSADGTRIPRGESNLVYRSAKGLFEKVGKQIPPLKITQTNPIPMARGLGSSSACIIAGLLGANRMLGDVLNTQELLTLATSSSGAETVCVNSVTTKTSTAAAAWFAAAASTNANYGPTHNTVAGVMKGIDIATVRYAIFKQSALANVSTDNYPAVIEEFGHDLKEEYLPYINGNGFAILFTGESGVTPETTYVFMATATNTVGDKVTKWGSATTSAAPDAARAKAQAATRTDEPLRSPAGKPIANPEKFIYPMESVQLPAGAKPEGDLWTIIHNTHNIK